MGSSNFEMGSSNFEIVKATRKCSVCKRVEYNARTCKGNTKADELSFYNFPNAIDEENTIDIVHLNMAPAENAFAKKLKVKLSSVTRFAFVRIMHMFNFVN